MSFVDDDEIDEVDAEWQDFAKAMEAFREKRAANNMCSFYPCPPPAEEYDTMVGDLFLSPSTNTPSTFIPKVYCRITFSVVQFSF